jgi:hypothetical protein
MVSFSSKGANVVILKLTLYLPPNCASLELIFREVTLNLDIDRWAELVNIKPMHQQRKTG